MEADIQRAGRPDAEVRVHFEKDDEAPTSEHFGGQGNPLAPLSARISEPARLARGVGGGAEKKVVVVTAVPFVEKQEETMIVTE